MEISETEMISATVEDEDMVYYIGNKQYELSNHLGNVLAVITDKKIPIESTVTSGEVGYYEPEIVTAMDYSPFGVILEDRKFESDAYRYGFQGQEKDDEIKGEGNSINFTYRMHDTRLGRFFAVDPLSAKFPHMTPYQFAGNKPIWSREIEGLESEVDANQMEAALSRAPKDAKYSFTKSLEYNIAEETFYIHFDVSMVLNNQSGMSLDELKETINNSTIETFDERRRINYSMSFAIVGEIGEGVDFEGYGEVTVNEPICKEHSEDLVVMGASYGGYPVSASAYSYTAGDENKPVDWAKTAWTVIHEFLHPLGLDDLATQWDNDPTIRPSIGTIYVNAPDVYYMPNSSHSTYISTSTTIMKYVYSNLYNYNFIIIDGKSFKDIAKPGDYQNKLSPDQMYIISKMVSELMR